MHKKLIGLVLALFLLPAAFAMAEEKGSGCGLGKKLFAGKSGTGNHVLAATTNGTSGNQTFGITSGTSGCDKDAVILNEKEQEVFVAANLANLSQQMAQGDGEHLRALATLMGCSTSVYTDFAGMTQAKYDALFPVVETGTPELLSGLKREMSAHPTLSAACMRIS